MPRIDGDRGLVVQENIYVPAAMHGNGNQSLKYRMLATWMGKKTAAACRMCRCFVFVQLQLRHLEHLL